MRLRINGPKDLNKFPAEKYAKEWVHGHQRTDDPLQVGGTKRPRFEERDESDGDTQLEILHLEDNEYLTESHLF